MAKLNNAVTRVHFQSLLNIVAIKVVSSMELWQDKSLIVAVDFKGRSNESRFRRKGSLATALQLCVGIFFHVEYFSHHLLCIVYCGSL